MNPPARTANIAVELFDHNGAPQNTASALSVPPGGTVQFATAGTAPFGALGTRERIVQMF